MVVLFTVASCSPEQDSISDSEAAYTIDLNLANKTDWEMANEILDLINDHRASLDLQTLQLDKTYASAYAVEHTDYMIEMNKIDHANFHVREAALKSRGAKMVGENVAYGYTDAETLVNAWLASPGHRRTIEEKHYTHTGFGVMQSEENRFYYTQLFYKQ